MGRIVMAWELGAGTGHLATLRAVGRKLAARGHSVTYLVRNLAGTGGAPNETYLQAPVWGSETQGLQEVPQSYSEILLRYGYHDTDCLGELVRGWLGLFELLAADLVVADHAPTALLAANIMGIGAIAIGSGFVVPPGQVPMPCLRPWMNIPGERLAASDQWLLGSINGVLGRFGKPALPGVSSLFDVDARYLTTFMELDHYPDRSPGDYVGPLDDAPVGALPVWPDGDGKRVFVYLTHQHRDFARIIELLDAMALRALVCAPGIPEARRLALETNRVRISTQKYRLSVMRDCDLAVNYGSAGMICTMLRAGIPMLMLPTHLEQFIGALRVQEYGCGLLVNSDAPQTSYVPMLRELLENPVYRQNAAKFSEKYAGYRVEDVLAQVVGQIETLMERNRP